MLRLDREPRITQPDHRNQAPWAFQLEGFPQESNLRNKTLYDQMQPHWKTNNVLDWGRHPPTIAGHGPDCTVSELNAQLDAQGIERGNFVG